ncbi:MAG: hypothetical protein KatS3mg105_4331 [Gemmatales bacterium]|nr:MAG: hypothetical protein KatS3mg105_4331 [Gemmatales bacterium]
MPIRFRCAYCNQLMGIARRKAGTVVRCPNCSGQVVVPTLDQVEPPPLPTAAANDAEALAAVQHALPGKGEMPKQVPLPPPPPPPPVPTATSAPKLFERSDFDEQFQSLAGSKQAAPVVPPSFPAVPPAERRAPLPMPSEPADLPNAAPDGIVISSRMATLLAVVFVICLALAFTAGLVVGRFVLN